MHLAPLGARDVGEHPQTCFQRHGAPVAHLEGDLGAALRRWRDPTRTPAERNLVRAVFATGPAGLAAWPVLQDGDALDPPSSPNCARLSSAPRERGLIDLVGELRSTSAEFARLWDEGAVGPHVSARKTVVHPEVGEVMCDCDVLTVPGSDIRLIVHTVAAGSADAEKLEFLRVTNGVRTEGSSPSGPGLSSGPDDPAGTGQCWSAATAIPCAHACRGSGGVPG
ncbi:hypothetical protein ACIQXA_18830 [Streptomyces massasporeus]|uniref:MmyB family transcriptional regulator n=1 Tax=Streptomyces massasporeus TaxID=67324 RepID=UPI00381B7AF7